MLQKDAKGKERKLSEPTCSAWNETLSALFGNLKISK
jgi:hypothetical protein